MKKTIWAKVAMSSIPMPRQLPWGRFIDDKGNVSEAGFLPSDDEVFLICCGPWPNPHPEARQVACNRCGAKCALLPKGWSLHQANSNRELLCRDCVEPEIPKDIKL